MTDGAVMTPGSATEAFEKSVGTPVSKNDGEHKRKKRCCSAGMTLLVIGAVMVIVSIVYSTALPSVVNKEITTGAATCKEEDVQAETFTDRYSDCEECTPYYYSLSMFNVTNAMDHLTKGAKLKVQEVGPYVYRRREIRVDVKLLEDGNKVSYKMYTYHTYEPEMSCEGCSDKDMVVSWDVGYLNVISQAGGERGFLRQLIAGSFGTALELDEIDKIIDDDGPQIMKWVNGLNSNEPKAWKLIGSSVLPFLSSGVTAISALKLDGFEYNGLFVRRSMSQWALGYPSLLAGLALGSNYVGECAGEGMLEEQCKNCKGDECLKIWAECKKCSLGAKILAINKVTCATIESIYAAEYGAAEAKTFVEGTCATFCEAVGLCAAPLPGAAEDSGLDYSKTAPPSSILNEYVQRTGCDDLTKIGEYIQYDGFTTQPYWVKLDKRRNPTLEEINAFQVYGNCDARTANMTCADVLGQDATGIKPYGASISGFPGEVDIQELQMYLSQAKQNISLVNTGIVVDDVSGIKMSRFIPPNDLLRAADWKSVRGTAYPVDGVQPLAFNVGFLAYLSYPMFLYGDKSLTDAVEITMYDGKVASNETLFENGELKKEYYDRYQTVVDIEPGTGKTMRARKRLQASYAMAKSQFTKDAPMSDVLWPELKSEVISPAYIGEESATITPKLIDTYKMAKGIVSSFLPVIIAGVIVGVGLFGFGFMRRRREAGLRKQEFV